nr:MAG TPA: hypothetical protein [Caudoviricetes sp.]
MHPSGARLFYIFVIITESIDNHLDLCNIEISNSV